MTDTPVEDKPFIIKPLAPRTPPSAAQPIIMPIAPRPLSQPEQQTEPIRFNFKKPMIPVFLGPDRRNFQDYASGSDTIKLPQGLDQEATYWVKVSGERPSYRGFKIKQEVQDIYSPRYQIELAGTSTDSEIEKEKYFVDKIRNEYKERRKSAGLEK